MNEQKKVEPGRCPSCASGVLHFEGDHFCPSCDWSTMFADVQSGRFAQRIGLSIPAKQKAKPQTSVASDAVSEPEKNPLHIALVTA